MHDSALTLPAKSRIPARSVALPVEHGAWGFLLEPLLAGLLIAPSLGGAFLSVFVIGAFLCRQPLKFVVGDLRSGKRLPRTAVAMRWLCYFSAVSAFGFIGSIFTADARAFIPLVLSAPIAVFLILQDASRKSRETIPELLAATVLSTSIASLALAAGSNYLLAAALWLTMTARLVPSVIYVRNRLRLEKKKEYSIVGPFAAHAAALIVLAALYRNGLGSLLTVFVAGSLLVRSVTGLSAARRKLTARQLGVREVIYGVIYALSVVIGWYAGF
jgi:hypothetical protein